MTRAINISDRRVARDVSRAWQTGKMLNASTRIAFNGTERMLWSFRGPARFLTGRMDFWHYDKRVLAVDFDRDLITDFGFYGHSKTTSRYLSAWMEVLYTAHIRDMVSLNKDLNPFTWTRTINHKLRGAGFHEIMWQRFRAGVPWAKQIDGVWWFHGPSYSLALEQHWYTYGWDAQGA